MDGHCKSKIGPGGAEWCVHMQVAPLAGGSECLETGLGVAWRHFKVLKDNDGPV